MPNERSRRFLEQRPVFWISLASVPFLLIAVAPISSYGYYVFLRLVVLVSAGISGIGALGAKKYIWAVLFWLVTILFNPFIPIHLDKETWVVLDLLCAALMLLGSFAVKRPPSRSPD